MHRVPGPLLSIQLPANTAWKAEEDDPSTWASATHVGDPEEISNSCLWPRLARPSCGDHLGE